MGSPRRSGQKLQASRAERMNGAGMVRLAGRLVLASWLLALALHAPAASASVTGRVGGEVVAKSTGSPIGGATVLLPDYGLVTSSRADGSFNFPDPIPSGVPFQRIRAVVKASGWGTWTIEGVPVYPSDTLRLHVELETADQVHSVLAPGERRAVDRATAPTASGSSSCTGWSSELVPPSTISVYDGATGSSIRYNFMFYLRHVLPNEWISSWDADALGAGAIAAKTYAWYRTLPGHAYSGGDGCADVTDSTGDQVFDPTWSTDATDQAVNATYGSVLWRDGGIFLSQYWAGSSSDPCAPVTGTYAGRMSQWGTQTCAGQGMLWPAIVQTYYQSTSWVYRGNLLLNPDFEDARMRPWRTAQPGSLTRTQSASAYRGGWYLRVADSSTLHQVRPVRGTATTTYRLRVALRCGRRFTSPCTPTLAVRANAATGAVSRQLTVSVPNDGAWHVFTFSPEPFRVAHASVEVDIATGRTIGIDCVRLTGSFGGA
jgi:hypothetical protein